MSQTSVTPSHNLLTIMCLTLHLFTETFTLKENSCIYTLVIKTLDLTVEYAFQLKAYI